MLPTTVPEWWMMILTECKIFTSASIVSHNDSLLIITTKYLLSFRSPINSGGSSDDEDRSQGAGVGGLSALSAAYTPKQRKPSLAMNERRRAKLREIEVRLLFLSVRLSPPPPLTGD